MDTNDTKMNRIKQIAAGCVLLAALSVCAYGQGGKVLHFPKDRSLGKIKIADAGIKRQIRISHYDGMDSIGSQDWSDWMNAENFSEAQGDVVIPAGKKVGLFLNENAFKDLSPLENLKPDDLYILSQMLLDWDAKIALTSQSMQHISHLTGLKSLRLFQTVTTTAGMKHITKLQSLEMLQSPKGLTNKGLLYIAQLGSLKRLYFTENRVTNTGLKHCLPKLTELEELILVGNGINDDGLEFLADMPKLAYLSLRSGNFTDAGLVHARKCSPLRIIDLMHLPVTDVGLQHLSGHPRLESLLLFNTEVTDRGLPYLKSMPNLKKLHIGKRQQKGQITDAGMVHLAQINSLEYLSLPNRGITDKGLATIANLKNLKYLWVYRSTKNPLTDTALWHVSKLRSLEYLFIGGNGFTDAGMDDLAKLTNLRRLSLMAGSITNEGPAKLKTLQSLERLSLRSKNVTISGLSGLNALKNLTELRAEDIKQDNSGLNISGLLKLERLTLSTPPKSPDVIVDADLACLSKLKRLRNFVIQPSKKRGNMDISGEGLKHLAGLTELQILRLGGPNLKDEDFRYFANMKNLLDLYVNGGSLTDDCLRHLEVLPQLRSLKIYMENDITDQALGRLDAKMPNLKTIEIHRDEKKNNQN